MGDKKAAEILIKMMNKHSFSEEEKEAVQTAIGILSWSKLGQGMIKNIIKSKKEKKQRDLGN